MALTADDLIDRRRLRGKVTFWRAAAFIILALAIAAAALMLYRQEAATKTVDHIAKVRIEGTITEDEELIARLEDIGKSPSVKGVILAVDSPGGTTAGGEAIFDAVRELAGKKPVVTQVGTLAASAGYMIASAADHIVARKTSIVGSIGVLLEYPDVTGLMDKLGIRLEAIKSSPLKAEPSPFTPATDAARAMVRSMIMDSYDWFVGIVSDRRKLPRDETLRLADGSVFTGRQALGNKLIDELGGEKEAVAWLRTKGVPTSLEVIEWKPQKNQSWLFGSSIGKAASALGLAEGGEAILNRIGADRLFLDGLVSLWHPS